MVKNPWVLLLRFILLQVLVFLSAIYGVNAAQKSISISKRQGLCMVGKASWYGPGFHGRRTATGERFNMHALSAAHPWWPMGTCIRVTNLKNKRFVVLRINDRMPTRHPKYHGRVLDLSKKAAEVLGFLKEGITKVHMEVVSPPVQASQRFCVSSTRKRAHLLITSS